jgi:iron complex outermembrane receptor protein
MLLRSMTVRTATRTHNDSTGGETMTAARNAKARAFERRLLPALVATALAMAAGEAAAQQAPAAPAKDEPSEKLESITVTATKRSEPLQSVPVAVSVVSGDLIEKLNLNNISTLTSQTPALNYRANASNKDTSLFIRGVGTISTSPGVEPTVSTVIDGVVFARPGSATLDLMDVERIEVLRGPQGTLFGKNASAGVLNIVTKRLTTETERFVDASYYQGNERRLRAGVMGELAPGLLGSISGLVGKFDGNVRNVFLGEDVNGYDRQGLRGKLEWAPNRDVTVTFIADYAKADDTGTRGPYVRASSAITAAIAPAVPGLENRDVSTDVKERVEDKNQGLSAQVDWSIGKNVLTSITAWRKWNNVQYQDIDGTPGVWNQITALSDRGQLENKTFSQEFRFASDKGGFFDYVAGLYYWKTETDEVYRRDVVRCATTGPNLPNGLTPCLTTLNDNGVATYGTDGKSVSVFGESVLNFTKSLRGILGLRYTKDELSYYHGRVSTQPTTDIAGVRRTRPNTTGETDKNGTSGRIGGQFDFSKEVTSYLTYSRGYKGPAYNAFFNMQAQDDIALDPEKSKGWEAGLKSTTFDNRLRFNVAVFDTEYNGYQANFPDVVQGTVVTRFINAGDVSTKGIEIDFEAKISKQLSISGAFTKLKARVDKFNCPPGGTCPALDGQPLPYAPDKKGVIRADYWMPLANGWRFETGADYTWQSDTQYDLSVSPNTIQPAYGISNIYFALADRSKGWRVAVIGKNLADKSYSQQLLPGANTQRSVPRDDERYWGVNARYEF